MLDVWCTDHQLGCLVWWLNPACSHERYTPTPLLSLHSKRQLAGCSLGYMLYFCVCKRPLLADRHRRSRLAWCLARRGWNLRTWRKIHWSDESRFLLHVTESRMRVCRHKNSQCCLSTGLVANGIRLTKRCNALSSRSDWEDVSKLWNLCSIQLFLIEQ
jgi:hypothetical protein